MTDDAYWYAAKPAAALIKRQALSLEERGAAITYQDNMHERDGTIPDERTAEGLDWHRTVLKVRDKRTIERIVNKLLAHDHLMRLNDGRLSSPEVQKELLRRARRKKSGEGSGGTGGGEAVQPRQLVLIEGGLSPQPSVDNPVDEAGTENETVASRVSKSRLTPDLRRKTQRNQRSGGLIIQYNRSHDVVVAESRIPARARGDPLFAPP